jgi:hypothetical protein
MNINIYETIQDLKSRVLSDENKIVDLQQNIQDNQNKIRHLEALLENTLHAAELIMNDTSKSSASTSSASTSSASTSSASTSLEAIEKAIGKARQKVIADANANVDKIVCKNIMTTAGKIGAFRGDILCFVKDGKVVLPSVKEFNEIVDATPELSSELIVDKKRKNFKEVCKWVIA